MGDLVPCPPGWREEDGALVREWTWPTFRAAIRFVDQIADVAEALDHHPDIDIRWVRTRLALRTHAVGRITGRDLELAAAINEVADRLRAEAGGPGQSAPVD
ncbi:MAG: 4a-hydroxytetrahydrobiopterin dehydratase [Actinomycetia bacterium]|nr:4a-hydroxytetrahydrobiopterin dehydratase [Actinomycetes bacterium]